MGIATRNIFIEKCSDKGKPGLEGKLLGHTNKNITT